MEITRDTNLEDIDICPSYDCGEEDQYKEWCITSEEELRVQARVSIYKYSIFECDNCGVEFRGMARPLFLEKMPCYRCGQKEAGFKERCSQDEDDDD